MEKKVHEVHERLNINTFASKFYDLIFFSTPE